MFLNNARTDLTKFVDANDAARNGLNSVIVTSENADGSYSSDIVNKNELDQNITNTDTAISSAENDVNTANTSDSESAAKTAAAGLDAQIKEVEAAIKNLDEIIKY